MRPAEFRFDPSTGSLYVRELYGPTGASYAINEDNELVITSDVGSYSIDDGYVHLLIEENDAFDIAVKLSSRTLTCRGTLLSPGSVTTQLTAADIVGFQIDESCADSSLPIGSARAAKLSLKLNNSTKEWLGVSLDGYKLSLELGILFGDTYAYAPIGEYIIEEGRAQEQDTVATYTGSDRMAGTMLRAFVDDTSNYPCNVLQLMQRVATQAQITFSATSFINSAVYIPSMPSWPENTTLRDVAGYVACLACGFARIGRTGELEIVSISNTVNASIGPDRYKTLDKPGTVFGPLNAILVSTYGAPEGTAASRYAVNSGIADDASNAIQITENPLLAYGSSALSTLAGNMLTAIGGLTAQAATLSWPGDPTWECGDRIAVTDLSETTIETIITKQSLVFGNGFSAKSSCTIDGVTKSESQSRSNRILTPQGNVNASKVVGPMDLMRIWMHASENFVNAEIINGKGAIRENTNPESPYYGATYEGTGWTAFANEKDINGNWIWRIGITPRGIAGDQVWIETEGGAFLSAKSLIEGHEERIGTAEQAITPTAIVNTVRSSTGYSSDLAGKNRTFMQDTAPTSGMVTGDLWINTTATTGKNIISRYNGTAWVIARDTAIAISEQTATMMSWIVASGTSQANMMLTDKLYQLIAENIDLSASSRIMLAVKSETSGSPQILTTDIAKWETTTALANFGADDGRGNAYIRNKTPLQVTVGESYTIACKWQKWGTGFSVLYLNSSGDLVGGIGRYTDAQPYTFTIPEAPAGISQIRVLISWTNYLSEIPSMLPEYLNNHFKYKLEYGVLSTGWEKSKDDPASGVNTSSISIYDDHIESQTDDYSVKNSAGVNMLKIADVDTAETPQGRMTLGAPGYPVKFDGDFILPAENIGLGKPGFMIHHVSTSPDSDLGNDGDIAIQFNGVTSGWAAITASNLGGGNGISGISRTWNDASGVPSGYVRAGNNNSSGKYGASFSFIAPGNINNLTLQITAGKAYSGTWYGWNLDLALKVGVFGSDGTLLGSGLLMIPDNESIISVPIDCTLTASTTYYIGIYDENTSRLKSVGLIKTTGVIIPANTSGVEPYGIHVKSNGMWYGALMSVG